MFLTNLFFISGLHSFLHFSLLKKLKNNIKWYANHAISNLIIVLTTSQDCLRLLNCEKNCQELKPRGGYLYEWTGYNNIELVMVTNMMILHGYHILLFDNLRLIDYIHHILMMLIILIAYFMQSGVYMSYFLFFVCGLPGLIDYTMLSFKINRSTEKYINTYLNNYVRAPGIIFGLGLMWKDTFFTQPGYVITSFITLFWNAMYFNYAVIKNYYSNKNETRN